MSIEDIQRVRKDKLPQQVVEGLRGLLEAGGLRLGDQLPNEAELARRFGVGRNSVREAIRHLETVGLIEVRHGEGTFVRAPNTDGLVEHIRAVVALSPSSTRHMLEFRTVLEPGIAAMAASTATPGQVDQMRHYLNLKIQRQELHDREGVLEADLCFHLAVAEATGNPLVLGVATALLRLLRGFRQNLLQQASDSHDLTNSESAVLEAIAARDGQAAASAMRRHMEYLLPFVEDSLLP